MTIRNGLFSSESVSEGHPDKLADRISDRILDAFLARDPQARVACETMLADQCVIVAGEFKTRNPHDFHAVRSQAESLVREVLRETGYTSAETGIDPGRCEVQIRFNWQAQDISQGVDRSDGVLGAGDQGMMFGYATDETPERMPAPILYAHRLVRRQAEVRRSGQLPWLRPDAKSQVTFRYRDGLPVAIESVVLSTQHDDSIDTDELRDAVEQYIIDPVIPAELRSDGLSHLHQPDRAVCHGRSQRRYRTDGPQDHRGHLWWSGSARRRGVLRQGPFKSRSLRSLHGTFSGQTGCSAWMGTAGAGSTGIRHRRCRTGQLSCRDLRD